MNEAKRQAILKSAGTSFWLREAYNKATQRDCCDAANDAEVLAEMLRSRAMDVVRSHIAGGQVPA